MRSCRTRSASVSFPFFLIVTSQQELNALERLDDVADAEQALHNLFAVDQRLFHLPRVPAAPSRHKWPFRPRQAAAATRSIVFDASRSSARTDSSRCSG